MTLEMIRIWSRYMYVFTNIKNWTIWNENDLFEIYQSIATNIPAIQMVMT